MSRIKSVLIAVVLTVILFGVSGGILWVMYTVHGYLYEINRYVAFTGVLLPFVVLSVGGIYLGLRKYEQ